MRSQTTSARSESTFNWTTLKKDVSDCVSRFDNLLTPDRWTARFEATPEVNKHSLFSGYQNSRNRSWCNEDRDVSSRASLRLKKVVIQLAVTYQFWSWTISTETLRMAGGFSMSIATVDQRSLPGSEKMSHPKTLPKGKFRSAMVYLKQFYDAVWSILERNFGRLLVIINEHMKSLREGCQWRLTTCWLLYLTLWTCLNSTGKRVICHTVYGSRQNTSSSQREVVILCLW